jgi:hypothetical protein
MAVRVTGAALAGVLLVASSALGQPGEETLRCGGRLVRAGVSMWDVLADCGPPTVRGPVDRVVILEQVDAFSWREVVTEFEQWGYDRGSNEFVRMLTFRDGLLVTVQLGGYGASAP